jgi:hypothetical protein
MLYAHENHTEIRTGHVRQVSHARHISHDSHANHISQASHANIALDDSHVHVIAALVVVLDSAFSVVDRTRTEEFAQPRARPVITAKRRIIL